MLDQMTSDQLGEFHLGWLPANLIFDKCTDETEVLVYDGRHPVSGIYLADLEIALEDGGSRDEVILLLHEMVDQLEAEYAQVQRWRKAHPIKVGGTASGAGLMTGGEVF
jgi:hypothetical protein